MTEAADRWYLSGPLGIGILEPRRGLDVLGEIVATNRLTLAIDTGRATRTWHLDNVGDRLRIFDQPTIDTPGTERLSIDQAGNVSMHSTGFSTLTVGAGKNGAIKVRHVNGKHYENDTDEGLYLNWGTGQPVHVGGGGRLSDLIIEGNVGIGTATPTTATGGRALHVHNPSGPAALRLGHGGGNGQQWEWQSTVINNTGAMNLSNLTGMSNPLTVLANGNVGIGTTTPQDKLHTAGSLRILTDANPLRFTSAWTGFPDAVHNQAEISNDTNTFKTLMIVGNQSAGVGRRVSVWDRLEVNGTFAVIGPLNDGTARSVLDSLPGAYSVIMAVEDRGQGTALVFYWRDGNGQKRKGWIAGGTL